MRIPSIAATVSSYDLQRLMDQTHPVCEMWDPEDPKGE